MLNDFRNDLREKETGIRKPIHKLGTICIGVVETTPVVWNGELYRFEWVRNARWGTTDNIKNRTYGCFHFVNMKDESPTPEFAQGYSFGCCHAEKGTMYVVGTKGNGGNTELGLFTSQDLVNWQDRGVILSFPDTVKLYNTSVCKGRDCYVMAIEIGGTHPAVGRAFTNVFATSRDLIHWEMLDMETYEYTRERYSACPVIRYVDGYYYMIYLESAPCHRWIPYIVRSTDLKNYELGLINPVMMFGDEDKKIMYPERLSEEEKKTIINATNCNNSDIDLCDYNGKTVILYSWGNQLGREFLARAEYDGPMDEFLKSFF